MLHSKRGAATSGNLTYATLSAARAAEQGIINRLQDLHKESFQ